MRRWRISIFFSISALCNVFLSASLSGLLPCSVAMRVELWDGCMYYIRFVPFPRRPGLPIFPRFTGAWERGRCYYNFANGARLFGVCSIQSVHIHLTFIKFSYISVKKNKKNTKNSYGHFSARYVHTSCFHLQNSTRSVDKMRWYTDEHFWNWWHHM